MKAKKLTRCPYLYGQSPKRIHCADNCFIKFVNPSERKRFYLKRCLGDHRKCNVWNAIDERRRAKNGGADE